MSTLIGGTTLNCIYFAMVIAGLIFALGTLMLGQLGGGDGDVDGDVDADGDFSSVGDLRIFSPITMATFVTVFGATGLIATLGFGVDGRLSLVIALVVASVLSLIVAYVYSRILVVMQGSTDIRQADMIGMLGQVTTPIPAGGLGEVLFEISGERGIKPARAEDQGAIPRGITVVVKEVIGGVLVVQPRQPMD